MKEDSKWYLFRDLKFVATPRVKHLPYPGRLPPGIRVNVTLTLTLNPNSNAVLNHLKRQARRQEMKSERVFFVKKSEKRWGRVFFVKKWTCPQRRVHYVQYQYFYFAFYLFGGCVRTQRTPPLPTGLREPRQEAQLSPSDRAMRLLSSNLANYHATVQKILIRQVLTKPMV